MKIHPLLAAALSATIAVACNGRKDGPVQSTSGGGTSTAPGQQTLEDRDQALVRVVQAIPEAPPADVFAGNDKEFSAVGFGTVTPYKPVREERFVFALKPAGDDKAKPMIESKQGVEAGRRYTILSVPDRDGAAKIEMVSDDVEPPAAGKAKLRIIHAAPEAGTAQVVSAGEASPKAIGTADYGAQEGFREVDPGAVSVTVKPRQQKGKETALLNESLPALQPGKLYTVVVAPGSEPGKPVRVINIEDAVAPAAADDGVHEMYPTGKEKAIQRESDESYEIHPDTDNVPPAQKQEPRPGRK